ncbi:hypothetical protein G647_09551 [Cladophialophora carrionii CBS 160.54]|uniref:Uncharacterized protein n=1 Tax=Cladophialophora carrionii CBS 160.54 TaxID=1279043 RepID=V9DL44_9EURO|nr:uncharacterized protein G647_09551 [Cladophialophora carrionii CBS 160.54]ETI27361.1 hypothetical protein G647_09551 [Cladophialophora carrionii CBS 160.54]
MDGVCIGCRFLWPDVPGRFCAGCGQKLFMRPVRNAAPPEASSAPGQAAASSEPQMSVQLNPFRLAANNTHHQDNNSEVSSAGMAVEHQTNLLSMSRPPTAHGRLQRDKTTSVGLRPLSPMEGVEVAHNPGERALQPRNHPGPPVAPSLPVAEITANSNGSSMPAGRERADASDEVRGTLPTENPRRFARARPALAEHVVIDLEESGPLASGLSSSQTRDARSRSPPKARDLDDGADHGRYRERDLRCQSSSRPLPPQQPALYRDSLQWRVFLEKFHASSPTDRLPTLASFWDEFYEKESMGYTWPPTTMVHIKDLAHRLITHFNTFNSVVRKRDEFLSEVARYLVTAVTQPCYRAWQLRRVECNNTTHRYLMDLLVFSHDLQWFLIRKPLPGAGAKAPSNAEFARYLFSIRHQRATVQVDQQEFPKVLGFN